MLKQFVDLVGGYRYCAALHTLELWNRSVVLQMFLNIVVNVMQEDLEHVSLKRRRKIIRCPVSDHIQCPPRNQALGRVWNCIDPSAEYARKGQLELVDISL